MGRGERVGSYTRRRGETLNFAPMNTMDGFGKAGAEVIIISLCLGTCINCSEAYRSQQVIA